MCGVYCGVEHLRLLHQLVDEASSASINRPCSASSYARLPILSDINQVPNTLGSPELISVCPILTSGFDADSLNVPDTAERPLVIEGAGDVSEVVVEVATGATIERFTNTEPEGLVSLQFSIPHALAMLLMKVPAGPQWLSSEFAETPAAVSASRSSLPSMESQRVRVSN